MRRRIFSFLFLAAFALLLIGCGSDSRMSSAPGPLISSGSVPTGRFSMTVTWPTPAPTRLIPQVAQSIRATVTSGSTTLGTQLVSRPASGNSTTVTFTGIPIGTVTLTATAYPNSDGTGTAQAQGASPVQVQSGQTASVTVTMNSTINHLELSPLNPTLYTGKLQQMTVTAKDASGNVVLLSGSKITWDSSNTAAAPVSNTGLVTAAAPGSTTLTVTDTESLKSASTTITVVPAPTPISWWKAENNALDSVDGNNGTLSGGVTFGPGHSGQGFVFNGTDGVVNLGDPENLKLTQSITIDVWVNMTVIPPLAQQEWQKIFFRGDDRDGDDPYFLAVRGDGLLYWHLAVDETHGANVTTPMPTGFHHIVATLEDSTGDMRLYLDGQLKSETTTIYRPAHDLDPTRIGGVGIGNHAGAPASRFHYPFNGTIDEVKIYNQVVLP